MEFEDMLREMTAACADARIGIGLVQDAIPHEEAGMWGVALPMSWMEEDGTLDAIVLFVPRTSVGHLLCVAKTMLSKEFGAAMAAIDGTKKGGRI